MNPLDCASPIVKAALRLSGAVHFGFAKAAWLPQLEAECYEITPQSTRSGAESGVYFVVRGERVLYVGQSVRMEWRCVAHQKRFKGAQFFGLIFDRSEPEREALEAAFIAALHPKENRSRREPPEGAWLAVVALLTAPPPPSRRLPISINLLTRAA